MMHDVGKNIGEMIAGMAVLLIIFVPLGIWKLVDILIWCYNHIKIGIV